MIAWRYFEEKYGQPCTLFHGHNGTRILPVDAWIDATVRLVRDGSHGRWYTSGFHVLRTFEEAVEFSKIFRKRENRYICRVNIDTLFVKRGSKAYLCHQMCISSEDWKNRIPL